MHNLSLAPSCLSPPARHLEPPSRLSLSLSLLLQHLIPCWVRSHGVFALWSHFMVTERSKPLTHFTVPSVYVPAPALWCPQIHPTHRSAIREHMYYDGCCMKGTFYQSFQLSTVCWLIPSTKISVLNVNYNSNKWALSTKSSTFYILLWKPFYELYYSCLHLFKLNLEHSMQLS